MRRITIKSRVSTEAWRFDKQRIKREDCWQYTVFGEEWTNARVYGTVAQQVGEKFEILWDIDDERSVFGSDHLCIDDVHGHQPVMLQLSAYLLEFRVKCVSWFVIIALVAIPLKRELHLYKISP